MIDKRLWFMSSIRSEPWIHIRWWSLFGKKGWISGHWPWGWPFKPFECLAANLARRMHRCIMLQVSVVSISHRPALSRFHSHALRYQGLNESLDGNASPSGGKNIWTLECFSDQNRALSLGWWRSWDIHVLFVRWQRMISEIGMGKITSIYEYAGICNHMWVNMIKHVHPYLHCRVLFDMQATWTIWPPASALIDDFKTLGPSFWT